MKANLFATILVPGLLSAPVQAATYQYAGSGNLTFHMTSEGELPAYASFTLSTIGIAPVFDWDTSNTWADFDARAIVRVYDGDGNFVPQYPSNRNGNNDMYLYGANCVPFACTISFGGLAGGSHVALTAYDQIINVSFGGSARNYQGFSTILTAYLPDNLVPTPAPAALPLFASVLGIGAWIARRRLRAADLDAA